MMRELRGSSRQHRAPEVAPVSLPLEMWVCNRRGRCCGGSSSHHAGRAAQVILGTSLWREQTSPGQQEQAGQTDLSPLHMRSINHCITIPSELRAFLAPSPHNDCKYRRVLVWRAALFLTPSAAAGGLSHSFPSLCRGQT